MNISTGNYNQFESLLPLNTKTSAMSKFAASIPAVRILVQETSPHTDVSLPSARQIRTSMSPAIEKRYSSYLKIASGSVHYCPFFCEKLDVCLKSVLIMCSLVTWEN